MTTRHAAAAIGTVASITILTCLSSRADPEAITQRGKDQVRPAVATSSNTGEHLVVWQEEYSPTDNDVYAQRVQGEGTRIGPELVIANSTKSESSPDLAHHPGEGKYLVVWEHEFSSDDHDIHAQWVAEDGSLLDTGFGVSALGNNEGSPAVAYNPAANEFLVVWEHREGLDEFTHNDIRARRLAADGTPQGGPVIIAEGSLDESAPALACTEAGRYLVVWQAKQAGSGEYDIHGQFLESDGSKVGGELAISSWENDQLKPRVACNPLSDEFLVVWEDHHWGWGDDWDIYGRRLSAAGSPAGGSFGISWEGGEHRENPDVDYMPAANEFLVAWEFEFGPADHDLFCRRVASDGSLPEAEKAISRMGSNESRPAVAAGGDLSYLVVWEDERDLATNGTDLYGDTIPLYMLSGRVFAGTPGDESAPLDGVTVQLWGSNESASLGTLIAGTSTSGEGWYGLLLTGGYDYYNIVETDLPDHSSVGATSVGGTVLAPGRIQYSHPLEGKILTGNKFWDRTDPPPGPWANFTPSEWVPDHTVTCTIEVGDLGSGLDVSSAEFSYSTDAGASWSAWQPAECTGGDGSAFETVAAADVSFGQDSGPAALNRIKFRIKDLAGSTGESGPYPLLIDSTPPGIIAGPTVQEVTESTATIFWETSEECDGVVRYGRVSGQDESEEPDPALVSVHTITLTGLAPSTTYHFSVASTDVSGKSVESRLLNFATRAGFDPTPPDISLTAPPVCVGTVELLADARDEEGVDRVEFLIDGTPVFTSFSPEYPYAIDTTPYVNGRHTLTARARDLAGNTSNHETTVDFNNLRDIRVPTVTISSPAPNATVSGKVSVVANLADDAGLAFAFLKVNGVSEAFEPIAGSPTSKTLTFEWDAASLTGNHTLTVEVYDTDHKSASADVSVTVQKTTSQLAPKLKIGRRVDRHTNPSYFSVALTVTNEGQQAAENVVIQDYLQGFQPIDATDATPVNAQYEATYDPYKKDWQCRITSNETIPAMQSRTFVYFAVPVLFDAAAPNPQIGHLTKVHYDKDEHGLGIHDWHAVPAAQAFSDGQWKSLAQAYDDAVKDSNYIITTNPTRLFKFGPAHTSNVQDLLSLMARLASHQNGVLGFLDKYSLDHLRNLVKPGGGWAKKMHPDYSKTLKGYLLVVGETAVVPASNTTNWKQTWSNSPTTNDVYHSDQRYSDTVGGDTVPDLVVGRIIGDDPGKLMIPIRTSIDVLEGAPGHGFDYSHALLFSGDGFAHDKFVNNVNGIGSNLTKKGLSVFKMHEEGYVGGTLALTEFQNHTSGRDFIYMMAHGNEVSCGFLSAGHLATTSFGGSNPVVFAPSCLTGDYEAGDLAESFLQNGAGVYIGSTEVSSIKRNAYCGTLFCNWFDPGKPSSAGQIFSWVERSAVMVNFFSKRYKFWVYEYNYYGDPKYGTVPAGSADPPVLGDDPEDDPPPVSVSVAVPAYTVETIDGKDHVEIPDGAPRLEEGFPVVPFYATSIDYPPGYEVQGVALVERSGLRTDTGLLLPIAPGDIISADPVGGDPPEQNEEEGGWYPLEEFDWSVVENPDGSTTLTIVMYPFYYDAGTTEVRFYPNYTFGIDYVESPVAITSLKTDKDVYAQGETVIPGIEFENTGEARDIVFSALIRRYPTGELVDGLQLRTLTGLTGKAYFAPPWPTDGANPGQYAVEAVLSDTTGAILDRRTETVQVGIWSGEIGGFAVTPERFHIGDDVSISLRFDNTGTLDITGTALIRVQDDSGKTIQEFSHPIANLAPGSAANLADTWNTSGALPGSYTVVGSVLFGSITTDPVLATITDASTGGPLITEVIPNPGGGEVALTWNSRPGTSYDVEFSGDLTPGNWITIESAVPSEGDTTTYVDFSFNTPGFYRIVELP